MREHTPFVRMGAPGLYLLLASLLNPLAARADVESRVAGPPFSALPDTGGEPGGSGTGSEGARGVVSGTQPLVPGDTLAIAVVDESLWTGQFTIRDDGSLLLPRLEPIKAAGLTGTQLVTRLTEALTEFVIDPVVTVNLSAPVPRVVAAFGAVVRPGSYDLATAPTLLTLVASAGGLTPTGQFEKAVIVRGRERIPVAPADTDALVPDDVVLEPNDTLFVPDRTAKAVFVLGAVTQPGVLPATEALDAATGIALVGGPTAEADLRNAFILRRGTRVAVNVGAVLAPEAGEEMPDEPSPLEPGDVLVVPTIRERSVFVVGGVKAPGPQPFAEADRASKAVAMAGGATPEGNLAGAYVLRAGKRLPVDLAEVLDRGNADADVALQAGDAVVVPEVPQTFHIVGAVTETGAYPVAEANTVLGALAASGGVTEDADLWHAYLVRGEESTALDLHALIQENDLSQNRPINPGDTLVVPRLKNQVYVMGAVGTPGPQPIRPGDRLMDILGRAGGISPMGKAQAVFVYRRTTLQKNEARVQLINLVTGRTPQQLRDALRAARGAEEVEVVEDPDAYEARPGDVIFVPSRGSDSQQDLFRELFRIFAYRGIF